jgi:hypothetical protein
MPVAVPDVVAFATLTELASSSAGTIVVITGAFAAFARAGAVLKRSPPERVERITAAGFAIGAAATLSIVCVDKILQGG